jgi:hypothetical protein
LLHGLRFDRLNVFIFLGLSRRFAIEDAFKFEDFTDTELREIMDGKLKKQDLSATDAAKDVAMELLNRERNRPNFGNGGAVENLLGHTKLRYVARFRGSTPPINTIFEPQDFDPEFDRHLHASENLDKMFEDIVGCEAVIDKLRTYQKISRIMKARQEDACDLIPTAFVFKGPPGMQIHADPNRGESTYKLSGTGKTTIARKIGQVYYDMGFLASAKVEECSASDLVGQYVGHTGPKTKKLFEKALGQVLFIDEAYRLGDGRFAQEAVDELVGLLTHEKFKSKIVVILAGYDHDINKLLSVNSGLSSRFPEVIQFKNFTPTACLEILNKCLQKNKIAFDVLRNPSSKGYSAMLSLVEDLSGISSWGNARDMETLAKQMSSRVLKQLPDSDPPAEFTLQTKDAVMVMQSMLDEKRQRSNMPLISHSPYEDIQEDLSGSPPSPPPTAHQQQSPSPPPPPPQQQKQQQPPAPQQSHKQRVPNVPQASSSQQGPSNAAPPVPSPHSRSSAGTSSASQSARVPGSRRQRIQSQPQAQHPIDNRDPGVPNAIWGQLQADEKAEADAAKAMAEEIRQAQNKMNRAIQAEERVRAAAQASIMAESAARNAAERQRVKRQREELERRQRAANAERVRLVQELNRKKAEERRRTEAEAKVQATLRDMGVCVQGYQWVKQSYGYRCRGGGHFIDNSQLGI